MSSERIVSSRRYPANEFRRALMPLHRCRILRNSFYDNWGTWKLPYVYGWRKDCPCRRLPS